MQLVGDPWLLDLAAHNLNCKLLAASLLRCQVRTQRATGHHMDFGDIATRSRIIQYGTFRRIPSLPIRCDYCGVEAGLDAWLRADHEDMRLGWPDCRSEFTPEHWPAVAYRDVCTSDTVLRAMADVLSPSISLAYLEELTAIERHSLALKGEI